MAKTPFLRPDSSSFEDEEGNNEADEIDPADDKVDEQNGVDERNHKDEFEVLPDQEAKIQISKKVLPQTNAMPVVNKMSQSVYADHQNQANHPPKGL